MKRKAARDEKAKMRAPHGGKRTGRVPPAQSALWPLWCRGKLWTREAARWFAGRCQLCAYACPPTEGRQRLDKLASLPTLLICTNHPDSPGRMREVMPTQKCRNFRAARWQPPRLKSPKRIPTSPTYKTDGKVRHIPVGHGLFATVDAVDYERLSKYKWHASNIYGRVYAVRHNDKGRIVYMHREIMHAPKGSVVDHMDHNSLNNRRCNLHVCTQAQNAANAGPRGGVSGYVGVYKSGKKWMARIMWRGKYYHLGCFDSPIEAAKARDRKAYELHGPYAYLNFPEDFPQRRKPSAK
jgi:hypothetical protein